MTKFLLLNHLIQMINLMNNHLSDEEKLKQNDSHRSPKNSNLNRSLSNISQDEKLLNKRVKKQPKTSQKTNETDINVDRRIFDGNKKDVELKKFQMDKCLKDVELTVIEKEKRRNVLLQNEFDKERNYLIDQQKMVKSQIEDVSKNNMNEKIIKMIKEAVKIYFKSDKFSTRAI